MSGKGLSQLCWLPLAPGPSPAGGEGRYGCHFGFALRRRQNTNFEATLSPSPLAGEGRGEGYQAPPDLFPQCPQNYLQHARQMAPHLRVLEAQHPEIPAFEVFRSYGVVGSLGLLGVLAPVQLQNQAPLEAHEVSDVEAQRLLPFPLHARLPGVQRLPHQTFFRRAFSAQATGTPGSFRE